MRLAPIHVLLLSTGIVGGVTFFSDFRASSPEPSPVESRRVYINHEFGFGVEIPFYAPLCDPANESQETGFVFFLDAGLNDCGTGMDTDRHWVSFHESYNAADYSSARESALCGDGVLSVTDPQAWGTLARWLPAMCQKSRPDGVVRISFHGLSPDGRTLYDAWLQTTPAELAADRAVFLATMDSLNRFTPDASDVRGTGWAAILSRELEKQDDEP
jgi:hypothetical protein